MIHHEQMIHRANDKLNKWYVDQIINGTDDT